MRSYLNPAQKGHLFDKAIEITRVAGRGSRSYDQIIRSMQDIIDGRFMPDDEVARGLFVSPEQQIKNLQTWNMFDHWGLTDEDFQKLGPAPEWPREHLCAVVLVPYFKSRKVTFERLRAAMYNHVTSPYRYRGVGSVHWQDEMKGLDTNSDDYVRHFGGAHLGEGLQWRIVSLGANRAAKPEDVQDQWLAAAEVLAAAAHFPNWVMAMNGREVPLVWLGGYRLMINAMEAGLYGWSDGRAGMHPLLYFHTAYFAPRMRLPDQRWAKQTAAVPVVKS